MKVVPFPHDPNPTVPSKSWSKKLRCFTDYDEAVTAWRSTMTGRMKAAVENKVIKGYRIHAGGYILVPERYVLGTDEVDHGKYGPLHYSWVEWEE